jgi:hypothetical protein
MSIINYSPIIKELHEKTKNLKDNQYCFTLYYPIDPQDPTRTMEEEIKEKFKALAQEHLRQFKPLEVYGQMQDQLVDYIYDYAETIDFHQNGAAIFIIFEIDKIYRERHRDGFIKYSQLTPLHLQTKEDCYIGKVFKLDQVMANQSNQESALAMIIHEDKATLYDYQQNNLQKINDVVPSYELYKSDRPYLQRENQPGEGQAYHGTGENKNWHTEFARAFFDNDILPEILKYKNRAKIVIFYSSSINDYKDNISKQLETHFDKVDMVYKSPITRMNLIQELSNLESQEMIDEKMTDLRKNKNKIDRFTSKITDILEAVNKAQIDTIYIKPNDPSQSDEIVNLDFSDLIEKNDLSEAKDLLPYIVDQVYEYNGKINVLYGDTFEDEPYISALLRY